MPAGLKEIRTSFEEVLEGEPWYGKAVYRILETVDPDKAFKTSVPGNHTQIELLYHMLTWSEFTLAQLEKASPQDIVTLEGMDWRPIDPGIHSWKSGLESLKGVNKRIGAWMEQADESVLENQVAMRSYNYRELLEGLIQHLIYHAAQIVILVKSQET
jgi:hypothetical protein